MMNRSFFSGCTWAKTLVTLSDVDLMCNITIKTKQNALHHADTTMNNVHTSLYVLYFITPCNPMQRTGLVYRFRSTSHWLKIEQHTDPSCSHHWSSIFRNEEEPTTTTTTCTPHLICSPTKWLFSGQWSNSSQSLSWHQQCQTWSNIHTSVRN